MLLLSLLLLLLPLLMALPLLFLLLILLLSLTSLLLLLSLMPFLSFLSPRCLLASNLKILTSSTIFGKGKRKLSNDHVSYSIRQDLRFLLGKPSLSIWFPKRVRLYNILSLIRSLFVKFQLILDFMIRHLKAGSKFSFLALYSYLINSL